MCVCVCAGQTALLVAASIGATAVIDQLLLGGANVERADGAGTTPLLAAVQAGHAGAALALLNNGASVTHAVRPSPALLTPFFFFLAR